MVHLPLCRPYTGKEVRLVRNWRRKQIILSLCSSIPQGFRLDINYYGQINEPLVLTSTLTDSLIFKYLIELAEKYDTPTLIIANNFSFKQKEKVNEIHLNRFCKALAHLEKFEVANDFKTFYYFLKGLRTSNSLRTLDLRTLHNISGKNWLVLFKNISYMKNGLDIYLSTVVEAETLYRAFGDSLKDFNFIGLFIKFGNFVDKRVFKQLENVSIDLELQQNINSLTAEMKYTFALCASQKALWNAFFEKQGSRKIQGNEYSLIPRVLAGSYPVFEFQANIEKIILSGLSGRKNIRVNFKLPVRSLHKVAASPFHCPVDILDRFVFKGRNLDKNKSLYEQDVKDNSVVYFIRHQDL